MNIADHNVLVALGSEAGLNEQYVAEMLKSDAYKDSVKADIAEARNLNISSLPAFVFNNKYVISGAQSEEVFFERSELDLGEREGITRARENGAIKR